jgi:hypothetical protein
MYSNFSFYEKYAFFESNLSESSLSSAEFPINFKTLITYKVT